MNDFDFNNQIDKALLLNEKMAQKNLLSKIMEINNGEYTQIMMQSLGKILLFPDYQENGQIILPFFKRTAEEKAQIDDPNSVKPCNMETFLQNPNLPLKSDEEFEYIEHANFDDPNKMIDIIVKEIIDQNEEKGKDQDRSITVEYSYMDFQSMILGFKMMNMTDPNYAELPLKYDKLFLSNLMIQEDNIEFYMQDGIQKFIDFQFEETFSFFSKQLIIYLLFFVMPFLAIIFQYDQITISKISFFVCFGCQNYFMIYEILQMRISGWSYFQGQNLADLG